MVLHNAMAMHNAMGWVAISLAQIHSSTCEADQFGGSTALWLAVTYPPHADVQVSQQAASNKHVMKVMEQQIVHQLTAPKGRRRCCLKVDRE